MNVEQMPRGIAPSLDEQIGERVMMTAWRQHLSQTKLATALDMSQPTLSRKLRGDRPWSAAELVRAANVLKISITDLVPTTHDDPHPTRPDEGVVRRQGLEPRTR